MRTSLLQAGVALRDVRAVDDPWGIGVVFEIRRASSKFHKQWLKERSSTSEISRKATAALLRSLGRPRQKSEGGEHELIEFTATSALVDLLDDPDVDPQDLLAYAVGGARQIDEALALLKGWSGLVDLDSGADVPYSEEVARQLLEDDSLVAEGQELGGRTFGDALAGWILEQARATDSYRIKVLGGAEKNSGRGPGGKRASGPRSTTSSKKSLERSSPPAGG